MGKLEWWSYPTVKNLEDMCNRLDSISACDRQTDILPRHSPRYAYASRCKNPSEKNTVMSCSVAGNEVPSSPAAIVDVDVVMLLSSIV